MSSRIRLEFSGGGAFEAQLLLSRAPKTVAAVLAMLPLEATVLHSRWSGREINFPVRSAIDVPREQQTSTVNTGDVIYWKEWELDEGASEALAVYYGAEVTRDHRGHLPVNVFARVPSEAWPVVEEIGVRIWRKGAETVTVSAVPEEETS